MEKNKENITNTKIIKNSTTNDDNFLSKFSVTSKNQFLSLYWLFFNLIKSQKAFFAMTLVIYLLFSIFAIFSISNENGFAYDSLSTQGKIVFFMSSFFPLIILLMSLPMVQGQVSSSLLLKRIGAMGFGEFKYSIAILFIFSIFSYGIFLFNTLLWSLIILIIGNNVFLGIHWFAAIVISLFVIILFASLGLLIGNSKMNQIAKGILSLFLILVIPMYSGMYFEPYQWWSNKDILIVYYVLLIINPFTYSLYFMMSAYKWGVHFSVLQYISSIVYIISLTLLLTYIASIRTNFNEIRR